GHELLDPRDHPRRGAAVAFTVGVAERAVAFVDDDHDLADRADDVQNLFEIAFRRADPFRPEVLHLDRRQPALFRERLGDERLARSHRAGEEDSHRHARRLAVADAVRDHVEIFFDFVHSADDFEAVLRLDELDETEAFALEDLALALRDEEIDFAPRLAHAICRAWRLSARRDERADLVLIHPRGQ